MITAKLIASNGQTAELELTMAGETRRVRAIDCSMNGEHRFIVFRSGIAGMYATGTKRHNCTVEINGNDDALRVSVHLQGARMRSRPLRVVGWYDDADPRNSRANLA